MSNLNWNRHRLTNDFKRKPLTEQRWKKWKWIWVTCPSCSKRHCVTGSVLNRILDGQPTDRCPACRGKYVAKRSGGSPVHTVSSGKSVIPPGPPGQRNYGHSGSLTAQAQSHGRIKAHLKQPASKKTKRSGKAPHSNYIKENLQKGQPQTELVNPPRPAALFSRAS